MTQIENGKRSNPDNSILSKIAILLDIPIEEIVKIKIEEFEALTGEYVNKLKIKRPIKNNSLNEKINKLTPEQRALLEDYVDSLLLNSPD